MTKTRINLIPKELLPRRGYRNEHGVVLLFTGLIGYILISFPLLSSSLQKRRAELDVLEQMNKKLKGEYAYLAQDTAPKNSEEELANTFRSLISNRSSWGKMFQELSLLPIPNVWLSQLKSQKLDKETVLTLNGMALLPTDIATFFTVLERSDHFRNVRLRSIEEAVGNAPRQFSFEFSIEIPTAVKGDASGKS